MSDEHLSLNIQGFHGFCYSFKVAAL